ncbi:ABC transporter ATP-binding protein [Flaviflexus massiliensis]|uniref:ABC transporter ATP-binding protein n=1 Tax=Flaviflexus massiliensis TaxID=1522309 RepID=UPI0006D5B180|nr:ABC transporter ATP-binding protein [Flaviflexus massiliensis]
MTAVQINHLKKHFNRGKVKAVDGIDLTINKGEIVAFLGPNGAGKTTTLDMVLDLTDPTAGSVQIEGLSPRDAIRDGKISAVLQTGGLLHDLKVGEVIDYVASNYRTPTLGRVVLERAGIGHLTNRKVSLCSGGEQQRLKFALSLLPNPDLLILDEPTSGMDVTARRSFWTTMQEEAREGRTVIFATHYLEEAQSFAERVILVSGGRVVADGPMSQIRHHTDIRLLAVRVADENAVHARLSQAFPDLAYSIHNGLLEAKSANSDDLARFLLSLDGVAGLEIVAPSLEDAFVDLTEEVETS